VLTIGARAQEKLEIEDRIKADQVPEAALEWMDDTFEDDPRIRWYLEISSGIKSFEAKFKWKGHLHSVEFDTTGIVQDIEIAIKWHEMPQAVQEHVSNYFNTTYSKFKVFKIQEQWTGDPDDLEDFIDKGEQEELSQRFEIKFYGKNDAEDELWEGLFNDQGALIERRIIILKPSDNLNF